MLAAVSLALALTACRQKEPDPAPQLRRAKRLLLPFLKRLHP